MPDTNEVENPTEDNAADSKTVTQPDRTPAPAPAHDDREYFDPSKHMPLDALKGRLERERAAVEARIAAEFGVGSMTEAYEAFVKARRENETLRGEIDTHRTALDQYKAEQAKAQRETMITAELGKAGIQDDRMAAALAVATANGIDFHTAFTEDGGIDAEAFEGLVKKFREGSPFMFGNPDARGTGSNRRGNPVPPTKGDVKTIDKDLQRKYGRL